MGQDEQTQRFGTTGDEPQKYKCALQSASAFVCRPYIYVNILV